MPAGDPEGISNPDAEAADLRTGILNAYHLPDGADSLYESISPVNSFRVVLNALFGTRPRYPRRPLLRLELRESVRLQRRDRPGDAVTPASAGVDGRAMKAPFQNLVTPYTEPHRDSCALLVIDVQNDSRRPRRRLPDCRDRRCYPASREGDRGLPLRGTPHRACRAALQGGRQQC